MASYPTLFDSSIELSKAHPGGAQTPPQGAVLGIIANNSPIRSRSGSTDLRKFERYATQAAARSILPMERINNCLRVPTAPTVDIHRTLATNSYHFQNLQTCGSVWVCPCCAAKISERRKNELKAAVISHESTGGKVYLLTLTLPHRILSLIHI